MSQSSSDNQLPLIPNPYEDMDLWKMPAVVPLSEKQTLYLSEVILGMERVIAGSSPLEVEEQRIFGAGQFFWPKDPNAPIRASKSYYGRNFRIAGMAARFQRKSEAEPWSKAGLTVRPSNFPDGVYMMQLPSSVFEDFTLQKVTQENRKGEEVKNTLLFYFEHKKIKQFSLKVEVRDDVENIQNHFPSSFHALEMTRVPN